MLAGPARKKGRQNYHRNHNFKDPKPEALNLTVISLYTSLIKEVGSLGSK